MTIWVLVLAVLFQGDIFTAVYNGGKPGAHEFKSKSSCEQELQKQMSQMDKILPEGAKLVSLSCVSRLAEKGA